MILFKSINEIIPLILSYRLDITDPYGISPHWTELGSSWEDSMQVGCVPVTSLPSLTLPQLLALTLKFEEKEPDTPRVYLSTRERLTRMDSCQTDTAGGRWFHPPVFFRSSSCPWRPVIWLSWGRVWEESGECQTWWHSHWWWNVVTLCFLLRNFNLFSVR